MRFAHIADCHLGGWRQPELQHLNLESFRYAITKCIEEKVNFIIFAGDLFDSAYPSIETLRETFSEFRKLKEEGIKCYIIAGSHDYSVSGKTFLDVLEKAGFCEICKFREPENPGGKIILKAHNHESITIYGYSGRKSGLEIEDLRKIQLQESNNFKILMLHTSIKSAVGNLPIDYITIEELPEADYYALGHLHLTHEYKKQDNRYLVYPGPTFPNNFQELEDLKFGSFYIVDINGFVNLTKHEIKLKQIIKIEIEIENALTATEKIMQEFEKQDRQQGLRDKIILLKLKGNLKQGKTADIKFPEIEEKIREKGAYVFLKNTTKLKVEETKIQIETDNIEKIEETIIKDFKNKNPSQFNSLIYPLLDSFALEKQEDEKITTFESRLLSEINKTLGLEIK